MSFFSNLFRPSPKKVSYDSFIKGKDYYLQHRWSDAIPFFNKALDNKFEDLHPSFISDIYEMRGVCLQALREYRKSIVDFDKSISHDNDNCNVYYQRANAKGLIGDYNGQMADIQIAIELSKTDYYRNSLYNEETREMGYSSATALYSLQLSRVKTLIKIQKTKEIED